MISSFNLLFCKDTNVLFSFLEHPLNDWSITANSPAVLDQSQKPTYVSLSLIGRPYNPNTEFTSLCNK